MVRYFNPFFNQFSDTIIKSRTIINEKVLSIEFFVPLTNTETKHQHKILPVSYNKCNLLYMEFLCKCNNYYGTELVIKSSPCCVIMVTFSE